MFAECCSLESLPDISNGIQIKLIILEDYLLNVHL